MINYESLPLLSVDRKTWKKSKDELVHEYARMNFDFLLSDMNNILQGNYEMNADSRALINIMGNRTVAGDLFYCQFFSILDAYDGYFTDRKDVDSYELRYTLEGSGILKYRGKKYTVREGEGFFISSREPHYYKANKEGWKCTLLHINGTLCQQVFDEYISDGSAKFSIETFPSFETLQFQVLQATQKIVPHMRFRISCLLDFLLTELLASQPVKSTSTLKNNEIIRSVIEYLQIHYQEKIIFDNLATRFGISRSNLFADFKQCTGYTPGNYLIELRLNQAKLFLRGTSLSIEEVATQTGFNDAGHFSQVFKKNIGVTPMKYRKL